MVLPVFMNKYMKEQKATIAADELNSGVVKAYIDSGCYVLNALLSADVYGGFASNKITCIAGEKATGKSWYCLQAVKSFLDKDPRAIAVYFDSESTISKKMLEDRGIDPSRVIIDEVITIDEFAHKSENLLVGYEETPEAERVPLMIVLDSLGQLTSKNELKNVVEGKDTRDLFKQQLIKKAWRVITVQSGKLNIPVFVTAHTYLDITAFFPQQVVAGGEALQYAASTIIMLTKAKDTVNTTHVGNIITCKAYKSRFTKEGTKVKTQLRFDTGLNRYYGLVDIADKIGVWPRVGNRYKIGDKLIYEAEIYKNAEQLFTKEVLDKINEYVKQEFSYGSGSDKIFDVENNDKEEEIKE